MKRLGGTIEQRTGVDEPVATPVPTFSLVDGLWCVLVPVVGVVLAVKWFLRERVGIGLACLVLAAAGTAGYELAVPAVGQARAHRTPLSIALAHAYHLWGAKPCGGHYRVVLVVLPEWAAGHTEGCTIELQAAYWTPSQTQTIWSEDCTTVLHEWGHALGHWHTDEGLPAQPELTPEQAAVMRSGKGNNSDDIHRCGLQP